MGLHRRSGSRALPHVVMQTEVGLVRERNEDSAHVDPEGWFVIVADGMGGHGFGELASAIAVRTVREVLEEARPTLAELVNAPTTMRRTLVRALLDGAVRRANREVYELSERELDKRGMGTTLEVLVMVGADAFVAHVGDSRTYLVQHGHALQLTTDHTIVETMRGRDGEAAGSPMRSMLVNAVGVTPAVHVELINFDLCPGDRLFCCTDGLSDLVSGSEIAHWVGHGPIEAIMPALVELACTRGGHDNITGIIVEPSVPAVATPARTNWDDPTTPRMPDPAVCAQASAAADEPSNPLTSISEDALQSLVEHRLGEDSGPIGIAPRPSRRA